MTALATTLRERIEALPGAGRLLPALEGLPPAFLVGGAVRDLLRGAKAVDLDVTVEGDGPAVARELARRLGGSVVEHERFGTATVRGGEVVVDLATARRETYPRAGALPLVEPASLADDLGRRDFTVNAMAATLAPADLGRLHDPHGGRADLERHVVRILHPRSFIDDPTRLLRAVRYEVRLRFAMDGVTEARAREAVEGGALGTVSGARIRDELLDLLAEPEFPAGLRRLGELGIDRALHPALEADDELAAAAALAAGEVGADRVLAALAALVAGAPEELRPWLEHLHVPAGARDRVLGAAAAAPTLERGLRPDLPPSELHDLLVGRPPEALALALARGAPPEPLLRFVAELRDVRLDVTGDDLVAAGIPPSPAIGRALDGTLRLKLEGRVRGREEELRAALALARGEQ